MRTLCIILLAVLPLVGSPQAVGHLTTYTKENGPSHRTVSCITKDKDGFLWLGTWNGINRYDGTTFKTFDGIQQNSESFLLNRRIIQILDDDDYLWILTYDHQIYWFNKTTERFHTLSPLIRQSLGRTILFNKIFLLTDDYIWLGTENQGIVAVPRRDRLAKILHYSTESSRSYQISSDTINIVHQDKSGHIWIGTNKGLDLLQRLDREYQSTDSVYTDGPVVKFAYGKWGSAFITHNSDILLVKDGQHQVQKIKIGGDILHAILFSNYGDFLYATRNDGYLFRVNLSTKAVDKLIEGHQSLFGMYEDRNGNVWIEQEGAVLYLDRRNNLSRIFKPLYAKQNTKTPFFCFEDINNRVWISIRGGGFGYFDENAQEVKFSINDIGSQTTVLPQYNYLFFYDHNGALWFTSEEKGFTKLVFSDVAFHHHDLFVDKHGALNDEVRSLMLDATSKLWVGTKAGNLYVQENEKAISPFTATSFKESDGVYSLLEDHSGNIWIGTKASGLFKAATKGDGGYTLSRITSEQHGLNANQIYTLVQDQKQRIWIGTFDNGLYKLEHGFGKVDVKKIAWKNHATQNRLFNKIRHISFDQHGNLWVATTEGLVIHAPHGETRFFFDTPNHTIKLGDNDIQYIFSDAKGSMYLCTSGGGLTKVDGNPFGKLNFTNYGRREGLYNSFILGGIADSTGDLWLSTEGGLIKYDQHRKQFMNMDSGDRLNSLSFSEKTVSGAAENRLFFGTNKGFLEVSPANIHANIQAVKLVLTRLWVNNEERNLIGEKEKVNIQYIDTLILSHDENNISVDFALTDFYTSNHNFSYRLLGLDSIWQQNGSLNRATFTNLKPGHYLFEVKGEYDLDTAEPFRRLSIVILSPWWTTWWAYSLYLCLTILILVIVRHFVKSMWLLKQRVMIEQKMAEVKMRFFTNISHELRTPLTLILSPVEQLLKSTQLDEETRQYTQLINLNAKRMQRFVDQLLELRQIQENSYQLHKGSTDFISLVQHVLDGFQIAAREKNIRLQHNLPNAPLFLNIDQDNIEIVLYNLLSNALKYTYPDTEIVLAFDVNTATRAVTLSIRDRGPGVKEEALNEIFELFHIESTPLLQSEKSSGIGLSLAKELIQLHGGEIWAKNREGGGLEVTFSLMLDEEQCTEPKVIPVVQKNIGAYPELNADKQKEGSGTKELKEQVLVVEDNGELRAFLVSQLCKHYQVIEAERGDNGLSAAITHQPDIIVSDVMMPGMDGIQLVKQLREQTETSHIPIILLSAKHAIETQIQGLEYGADYYITKPFHLDFLLASVQRLLKQRKLLFDHMLNQRELLICTDDIIITDHDREFLRKVISFVEEKMECPTLSIDQIADSLNMGRNTFYKKFKSLTDIPPVEFVRDMRLQKAKILLDQGLDNITEIAYQVGFSNPKYFSTCFRDKFGTSPKAYFQQKKYPEGNKP
ncbi:hybrid sensor histidine kinase/response regulator transcription factor [Sphingobacterium haloxyli]|uniref:histidine kinase n=1 Tax=Sphingobacterium haloxyli TaxID=2100533 RepID=A0A2S9J141_9SPHI|nr:hybrid sensor histidine kinase/response regulator transcription factor [Sphingobacterium haloxyli]PRD46497.1 hypothetical protein C5745_15145 [Sphingobacterium haloxyli]